MVQQNKKEFLKELEIELEYHTRLYDIDIKNCKIDSEGLIIWGDDLVFMENDFEEVPSFLKYFKHIKGDLDFDNCRKLKSLKNLYNLKIIDGGLDLNSCKNLISFEGLDSLEYIGRSADFSYTNIKDFTYLNNLKYIGWSLNLFKSEFENFKGLENLEVIKHELNLGKVYDLKTFEHLKSLIELGGISVETDIDCSELLYSVKQRQLSKTIQKALYA